jgi:hypothetical protein
MLKKSNIYICLSFICCLAAFDSLTAEIFYDYGNSIPEHETLFYQAGEISAKKPSKKPPTTPQAPQVNVNQLVKDAVTTCYNAYKPKYDEAVARQKEKLAGQGSSSYSQLIPSIQAKNFAETIVNQINVLTPQLSPSDRQTFWNMAGLEIKQVLHGFCSSHNGVLSDLDSHIDNLINMKKTFG